MTQRFLVVMSTVVGTAGDPTCWCQYCNKHKEHRIHWRFRDQAKKYACDLHNENILRRSYWCCNKQKTKFELYAFHILFSTAVRILMCSEILRGLACSLSTVCLNNSVMWRTQENSNNTTKKLNSLKKNLTGNGNQPIHTV